jgi:hypothetical protein
MLHVYYNITTRRSEGIAAGRDDGGHHGITDVHLQQCEHSLHHGPLEPRQARRHTEGTAHHREARLVLFSYSVHAFGMIQGLISLGRGIESLSTI